MKILLSLTMLLGISVAMADDMWPKTEEETKAWRTDARYAAWEKDDDGTMVLKVDVPPEKKNEIGGVMGAHLLFDITPYRGKQLEISVESKHVNLTKPSKGWLGFKMMLVYKSNGRNCYPGGGNGDNTPVNTDWRRPVIVAHITEDATEGRMELGVQDATGTLWFKNLRFRIVDIYPDVAKLPEGFKCEYSDFVKNMPIMRGCMSPGLSKGAKAEDLHELASWGANVIRWQVNAPKEALRDIDKMKEVFEQHLKNLDVHIPQLRKDGLQVIFDFHAVPGGRIKASPIAGTAGTLAKETLNANGDNFLMFFDKNYLDAFVDLWRMVARHYKDEPIVVGYDLYNEPVQTNQVKYDYLYCQYEAAKAIREIDSEKPIIIAANNWSSAAAFNYLKPLPLKNLIYQGHMYEPGSFTHQGVGWENMKKILDGKQKLMGYPGWFDNFYYDKKELRKILKPIRDFQLKYDARIYMGEFSAIRFAPGAAQYIQDLIEIFEEYGWDWSYHAFREWYNWSVEHDE
ncbi:MAG: cellulase family glycosylhydrolase, partial [Victivallales bacterium]|nr:cellulase family glycosylhydrolase [Victivallales bacterium]